MAGLGGDCRIERSANRYAVDTCGCDPEADDAAGEYVHDQHHRSDCVAK